MYTMQQVEVKIEGRDRDPIKAVLKYSDPIGRVTLGKRFGKKKLLILAFEMLDPDDRIFIEMENKTRTQFLSTGTTSKTEPRRSTRSSQLSPLTMRALRFILQKFDIKQEPSMQEVAGYLDISPRELGKVLRPLGIEAQSTSRNWVPMRLYPLKFRKKIETLIMESHEIEASI